MQRTLVVPALLAAVTLAGCSSGRQPAKTRGSIAWHEPIELAEGGGQRGEWRQNESDYDHVDDGSVVFADGGMLAAWVDHRVKDVFVQRIAKDGTRGAVVNVSRTPEVFSWLPRLAVSGDDVFVLWQEIVFSGGTHGGEAYFARSRDGGATFEPAQNLSRSKNGDGKGRIDAKTWHNGSFDLHVAGDGTIYAAWTEYDGPLWIVRSRDRGASFTEPARIDGGKQPARAPVIASDHTGRSLVAWTVGTDPGADLWLAVGDRDGSFAAPVRVVRTRGYSDAPKLAIDDAGVVHLAWAESTRGPFDPFAIWYARSRDGGKTFEKARVLSTPVLAGSSAFPMLAVDGDEVVVSWELGTQARGLALTYSRDGGTSFAPPERVAGSTPPDGGIHGSHQGKLMEKLALRDGKVAIANSALAPGKGSRVWLVRGELPPERTSRR